MKQNCLNLIVLNVAFFLYTIYNRNSFDSVWNRRTTMEKKSIFVGASAKEISYANQECKIEGFLVLTPTLHLADERIYLHSSQTCFGNKSNMCSNMCYGIQRPMIVYSLGTYSQHEIAVYMAPYKAMNNHTTTSFM